MSIEKAGDFKPNHKGVTRRDRVNRRHFLYQSALAGSGLLILPSGRTASGTEANRRINLAIIGDMYVGDHFITSIHAYEQTNIVALCNPDQRKVPKTLKLWQERAEQWPASS